MSKKNLSKSSSSLLHYIHEVQKFPLLTLEEEKLYATRFAETGDKEAAKMLIQSHLRLVVKMASKYRRYGLPVTDLIAEGNLGLIHATKKFDPYKGFRFSTYAMWWIRAFIQDYILRSWSLVKIGTTSAQKKLFFNLHKIKKKLGVYSGNNALAPSQIEHVAETLGVSKDEVVAMDSRLSQGDSSLNRPLNDEADSIELVDLMISKDESQEEIAIKNQEKLLQESLFKKAFEKLNDREKDILFKRQMTEDSMTLEELSQIYKVSRERIRQIEEAAIKKIRKEIAEILKSR
ncbi:MAG: RNA polymerase sigma factor RpoH [Alphaproteobacteria bacterium]|nr:RNA polymerase sigma factor RpoH [Alphaproteobacteria bacterium]